MCIVNNGRIQDFYIDGVQKDFVHARRTHEEFHRKTAYIHFGQFSDI